MRALILAIILLVGCKAPAADPIVQTWWVSGQSNAECTDDFSAADTPALVALDGRYGTLDRWTPLAGQPEFPGLAGHLAVEMSGSARVLSTSHGGTGLDCWQEGGECYTKYIEPYFDDRYAGLIWWQGESDLHQADTYGARLATFIATVRRGTGQPNLPVIVVVLEAISPDDYYYDRPWETLRQQQRQVCATVPHVYCVEIGDISTGEVHPIRAYPAVAKRITNLIKSLQ